MICADTFTPLSHLCVFFFFELKAATVNVYQNETVNLILRKHAIKTGREHAMPYHHAYNTESEPHFNSVLIHLIVYPMVSLISIYTTISLKVIKLYKVLNK